MYAQLGNIQFELIMISEFEERVSWSYAEHQVIEGKPKLQFIAENLDEGTIGIRLHFSFCDPQTQWDALRAEAARHTPLPFLFTNGKFLGRYVITDISKTWLTSADNGRPLDLQLRVSLKEYYDPAPLESRQATQLRSAPGLVGKGPIVNPAPAPAANRTALIGGQVTASAQQIQQSSSKLGTLTVGIQGVAADASAKIKSALGPISASVAGIMVQAKRLSTDAAGAAQLIKGYSTQIASASSAITRVTSGLPGPLGAIGRKMEALNRQISAQNTKIVTQAELASGGAVEVGTRAQIITRMLP